MTTTNWCELPLWYPDPEGHIEWVGIKPWNAAPNLWDRTHFSAYHERAYFLALLLSVPRCTLCGGRLREGQRIIGSKMGPHAEHFFEDYVLDVSKPGQIAGGVQ